MYNFTLNFRSVVLSLLLAGSAIGSSVAQSQMQARSYQNNRTYQTTAPELAVDALLSTAATVTTPLVGLAALRVSFPTTVQPGQQASLIIKSTASLATVLGGSSLKTFASSSQNPDRPIQNMQMDDPATIQVTVAPNDASARLVKFTATQPFDQLELDAGALVNTNYSVDVYAVFATMAAPLPVQLTAFSGKATETGVALKWATASERNADYFEVQRAEGLSDGFRSLGQEKCAGSSNQTHTYQFMDAASVGLHYYRLRQVDLDGAESFSPVVVVDAGLLASLTAYPTLASHTLNIAGPAGTHLSIFNQEGKQVQVADIAASQLHQLDVSSLPVGVYFLRDATTGLSARFVKAGGDR